MKFLGQGIQTLEPNGTDTHTHKQTRPNALQGRIRRWHR